MKSIFKSLMVKIKCNQKHTVLSGVHSQGLNQMNRSALQSRLGMSVRTAMQSKAVQTAEEDTSFQSVTIHLGRADTH